MLQVLPIDAARSFFASIKRRIRRKPTLLRIPAMAPATRETLIYSPVGPSSISAAEDTDVSPARMHEEFKRCIKTQTVLPSAEACCSGHCSLPVRLEGVPLALVTTSSAI